MDTLVKWSINPPDKLTSGNWVSGSAISKQKVKAKSVPYHWGINGDGGMATIRSIISLLSPSITFLPGPRVGKFCMLPFISIQYENEREQSIPRRFFDILLNDY